MASTSFSFSILLATTLSTLALAVTPSSTSPSSSTSQSLPGPSPSLGIYNSSFTPSYLPWDTYNYCNAPHVNAATYTKPENAPDAKLVYLNAMMRHHKRTPDNLYPAEGNIGPLGSYWDGDSIRLQNYAGGGAQVYHKTINDPNHPFASQFWPGTIDQGTLTAGGFEDAIKHGQDFWSVYSTKLDFLQKVTPDELYFRTSTSDRTYQVTSGLLIGFNPEMATKTFPVYAEPSNIDSLVPDYSCPAADNVRNAYQAVPAWLDHLDANADLMNSLSELLGVEGNTAWSSWYDHFFDTFTSRQCNAHALPCNITTGGCVAQADADRVYAIGDYEYNYIWNSAQNASVYNSLTFGVMFQELAANFKAFVAGTENFKLRFYVGHDGSMIRLASGLGFGRTQPLRWPALGSEIVFEVYETNPNQFFVRVLFSGTPFPTLSWVPLEDFISLLESNVPDQIFEKCNGLIPL